MSDSMTTQDQHNAEYFRSYGNLEVHDLMLRDRPRTQTYQQFLEAHSGLVKDKVVLDVGAGTGILSLFAARAGARRVYAVEASNMADLCQEIVTVNKMKDVITVMKEKVENVELPEKVDVIVSEWMGFYLLHESMLDSVLIARDKWLKEDGIMVPSHADIKVCPVNMTEFCEEKFGFWKDVYGFDFSPVFTQTVAASLQQPTVTVVKPDQCLAELETLATFDLKTMTQNEVQEIEEILAFEINGDSVLHGFATWFNVWLKFPDHVLDTESVNKNPEDNSKENGHLDSSDDESTRSSYSDRQCVTLSTSPSVAPTHWKQTVCFLPGSSPVTKGEKVYCKVSLCQDHDNKRHYNISLEMKDSLDDSSEDDVDDEEEDFEEDISHHPIPCDCGSGRCKIISAIMEKYDAEQTELEMEAEFTDVTAEVQAAQTLDNDSSYLDSEGLNGDEASKDE